MSNLSSGAFLASRSQHRPARAHAQARARRQEGANHDQGCAAGMTLAVSRNFKRPMEVVDADDISVAEKLALLEGWEADERALQRAEDEGMGGGERAHLYRVKSALARLRKPPL
jgi:hypothetical protein